MKISKITIENIKSFQKIELNIGNVNLFVGANAAGKSNLIFVFEFLRNIKRNGISKTLQNRNFQLSDIKNFNSKERFFKIELEILVNEVNILEKNYSDVCIAKVLEKIFYSLEIYPLGINEYDIREEINFFEYFAEYSIEDDEPLNELNKLSSLWKYGIINNKGNFETYTNEKELKFHELSNGEFFNVEIENPFHYKFMAELNLKFKKKSILQYPGMFIPSDFFEFGIYDIEPKIAKEPNHDVVSEYLEKSCKNLTQIINQILKNEEICEQFKADISGILDFIEDIKIENLNGLLTLKVKEKWSEILTEGKLLSDGTISIISLIVALYYQENDIIVIEEPERGIHPHLIEQFIKMLYDVAEYKNKQIIVTSQNPIILKNIYFKSEFTDIFTVQKKKFCSIIKKPDFKSFSDFLEEFNENSAKEFINEIGIDNLYIQNRIK